MPSPGTFCYESIQLARYDGGQLFMSHEDAFPADLASENQFQRRATLILYLNDVAEGGATSFDHLNVAVKPSCGQALLFFPAFASGEPDSRTVHTAEAAIDQKWIAQQWVACGFSSAAVRAPPGQSDLVADLMQRGGAGAVPKALGKKRGGEKSKKGAKAPSKGFGGASKGFGSK
ncbi:hypothetical protein CYMTET_44185 [Cymbomonas tetramitiformis]|uniref:Prolyl 4-hydroxylase alpha subunit domain-containing protein n=1 Tax=Cymbomonas tetramitiformis TaxID=36881 RepID=A0AAE0C1Y5_9CHLO|nr:hypothetical protein CYMTET_44185 [Cymbomonas tetramitiformis]